MKRWKFVLGAIVAAGCTNADPRVDETASSASDPTVPLPEAVRAALGAEGHDARRGRPVFEPRGSAIAYYAIDLEPGWAVVDARRNRVIELGEGGSPIAPLHGRLLRLDTAIYVAVDGAGHAIAQSVPSLSRIVEGAEGAELVPVTADEAIAQWMPVDSIEMRSAAPARTCSVPGDIPRYTQLDPHVGPNDSSCHSGCGPTAWAMIFGWASQRAAANPADAPFANLFHPASGSLVAAPNWMTSDVAAMTWELRGTLSTFCLSDQGATQPASMKQASAYTAAHAPGVSVEVDYSAWMKANDGLRDKAVATICDGRPAILGTGSLFSANLHYPVAHAYANGKFQLEMGWGGSGDGWYETATWFVGSVRH